MISLIDVFAQKNKYTQIVYSTHNIEFVNKLGLDNVILLHKGEAINFREVLTDTERDYLAANPNTDILKLLYSRKTILDSVYMRSSQNSQPNSDTPDMNSRKER